MDIVFRKSNSKRTETLFLLLLGLFSWGGGTGRFSFGLSLFDFWILISFSYSILYRKFGYVIQYKYDRKILLLLLLVCSIGGLGVINGTSRFGYDFVLTEFRFFIYLILVFMIARSLKLDVNFLSKILPYIFLVYAFIWLFCLNSGSFVYELFNKCDSISTIGEQQRLSGPPILVFVPLLLLMIRIEKIKQNIILLYSILVVIVFLQSGGRTYFIYNCIPIFYYFIRKKNKGLSIVFFFVLFLGIIFSVKNFSNSEFYSRFFNIVNLQNDSSFMYRVENIFEMFKTFNIFNALFGNGIGSNYIVFLYGWKESFFLDNSFITLVYKVGILGSLIFCSVFCVNKNVFPKDVYVFEIISLLIISSVSYHVILNPVFVFGYFVLYSYFFEEWFSLSNGPLRHSLRIPYKRIVV